jgi:hypothetical protein
LHFAFWRPFWIHNGRTILRNDLFLCQVSKGSTARSVFSIFCTLVTMATAAILNCLNPESCHTLRWIFLQSFMKIDEMNPFFLNPPFLFPWQLRQSLSNRFRLSCSTRCGCWSYQVSSISVSRVTCYDNFCVFNVLPFWLFPWQRQPFWKNKPLKA